MAPFRPAVPGASQSPGCGQSTRHGAQPRLQHGGSPGPSCKGKSRRCWVLLGMLLQATSQLLGEQPVPSSSPAASLLTTASCQHKELSAGAFCLAWKGWLPHSGTPRTNGPKLTQKQDEEGGEQPVPFFPSSQGINCWLGSRRIRLGLGRRAARQSTEAAHSATGWCPCACHQPSLAAPCPAGPSRSGSADKHLFLPSFSSPPPKPATGSC